MRHGGWYDAISPRATAAGRDRARTARRCAADLPEAACPARVRAVSLDIGSGRRPVAPTSCSPTRTRTRPTGASGSTPASAMLAQREPVADDCDIARLHASRCPISASCRAPSSPARRSQPASPTTPQALRSPRRGASPMARARRGAVPPTLEHVAAPGRARVLHVGALRRLAAGVPRRRAPPSAPDRARRMRREPARGSASTRPLGDVDLHVETGAEPSSADRTGRNPAVEPLRRRAPSTDDAPRGNEPLAARCARRRSADVVGQEHLLGDGGALRRAIEEGHPHSMILYGPPGTGKTTLARLVATNADAAFEELSAVQAGSERGARGDRARQRPPARSAGARSSSSTRSTASTRRSRTRCCRRSRTGRSR